MPEIHDLQKSSQKRWDEKHPELIKKSKERFDTKHPVWSFRPTPELLEWLEEERWDDEDSKPETNAALVIRKLKKLKKVRESKALILYRVAVGDGCPNFLLKKGHRFPLQRRFLNIL